MYDHYNATKGRPFVADRFQGSILKVEGMLVDAAAIAGQLLGSDGGAETVSTTFQGVLAWLASLPSNAVERYRCGGIWAEAYWRTICGDMIGVLYEMRRTRPSQ